MAENVLDPKQKALPAETDQKPQETKVLPEDPRDDDMDLKFFDKDFLYEVMSIPTLSHHEERLVNFIKFFAIRNGIDFEFDDYGNLYLTKGTLSEGEFYPCVTSHMDTVQGQHEPYIMASVNLPIKTSRVKDTGHHKIYVDGIGIGADDKGGIAICLAMFNHVEKLKACFFLEEEVGCQGSSRLNKSWFADVAYVIGYDSPELNRAAWSCSNTKLFSNDFYKAHMKPVCDKWGVTRFEAEPYTDVKQIREAVGVVCMNFGNGGYDAHNQTSEYSIVEEMDNALGMGKELIDTIGRVQYKLTSSTEYAHTNITLSSSAGENITVDNYDDSTALRAYGKYSSSYSYGSYYNQPYNSQSSNTASLTKKKEEEIRMEVLKYIVDRYSGHIESIKADLVDAMKYICNTSNVDFALFEQAINDAFSNEIKF